jgi:hypothetical protein
LRLRLRFPAVSFPFPFAFDFDSNFSFTFSSSFPLFSAGDTGIEGIVSGDGIEVEADAAVDRVMRGLSRRNVPENASLRGTGHLVTATFVQPK